MAARTRLGLYGGPGIPYGAFGPKTETVVPKTGPITRLGLYGGPRQRYGDFAPKGEIIPPTPEPEPETGGDGGAGGVGGGWQEPRRRGQKRKDQPTVPSSGYGPAWSEPEPEAEPEVSQVVMLEAERIDNRLLELETLRLQLNADESRAAALGMTLNDLESEVAALIQRRETMLLLLYLATDIF